MIGSLLKFIHLAERLKIEMRYGRTSEGNMESVAAHSYRVALMVVVFAPFLDEAINVEKALKMALVHDLVEIKTGDKPYFIYENNLKEKKKKLLAESDAMKKLCEGLPDWMEKDMVNLWEEYAYGASYEALFLRAIDKMEAQIQHNEADISIWNKYDLKFAFTRLDPYCNFDSFLRELKSAIQEESRRKINSK